MNIDGTHLHSNRALRRPLQVAATTDPPLHNCWAVNLSATGMGLVAVGQPLHDVPAEHTDIEVQLALPDSGETVRVSGRTAWRQRLGAGSHESTSFGVEFRDVSPEDRLRITQFLTSYRFQVAVREASAEQREALEQSVGSLVRLHFAVSETASLELWESGTLAALIVCGSSSDDVPGRIQRAALQALRPQALTAIEHAPRVVYFGPHDPADAVALFNLGLLAKILPPDAGADTIATHVLDACRDFSVRNEHQRLALTAMRGRRADPRQKPAGERAPTSRLVAESAAMRRVVSLASTIAPHRVGVLLQGETGTGKEVLAHFIHEASGRGAQPFVMQDCGALTETLLESELFGHVRGAFTGAIGDHPGLFALADGGTILLDEVENMPPKLQASLLRVLETGMIRPVGGRAVRHVDVRVVCASNRPLAAEVEAGRFRSDLFYRLNVFPIDVPPLRERRDDILPLARFFLRTARALPPGSFPELTPEAERCLLGYAWPGNARELRHAVERALILQPGDGRLGVEVLPDVVRRASAAAAPTSADDTTLPLPERLRAYERSLIAGALSRHGGVVRRAARELGTNRVTLARKARQLGLPVGRDGA